MRHYHREEMRHLNDSERYRDYDYVADDGWIGANERVPHGMTDPNEPPWSTLGPWETSPFAARRAFDEDRGQGRDYGRDLGLGYGREADPGRSFERSRRDHYDRGYARPRRPGEAQQYRSRAPSRGAGRERDKRDMGEELARRSRGPLGSLIGVLFHPAEALRAVFGAGRGPLRGKGKGIIVGDARIRDEVRASLEYDGAIDLSEIEVDVRGGEVTLKGSVPTRAMRYRAEDVAADVPGVVDVHNRLRLRPEARRQDRDDDEVDRDTRAQRTGTQGSRATSTTAASRR